MLHEDDIQTTLSSIQNGTVVKNRGHFCILLENFFSEQVAQRLSAFFRNPSIKGWGQVRLQEHLPRMSMETSEKSEFLDVSDFFSSAPILKVLEATLGEKLRPTGVSFWKDLPGYELGMHVDNNAFNCAIQIYIAEAELVYLGTSIGFGSRNEVLFTLPYRNNCGYLLKTANDTMHGLLTRVPENFERYSVYARYTYVR